MCARYLLKQLISLLKYYAEKIDVEMLWVYASCLLMPLFYFELRQKVQLFSNSIRTLNQMRCDLPSFFKSSSVLLLFWVLAPVWSIDFSKLLTKTSFSFISFISKKSWFLRRKKLSSLEKKIFSFILVKSPMTSLVRFQSLEFWQESSLSSFSVYPSHVKGLFSYNCSSLINGKVSLGHLIPVHFKHNMITCLLVGKGQENELKRQLLLMLTEVHESS